MSSRRDEIPESLEPPTKSLNYQISEAEDTLTLVTQEVNRRLRAGRVRDIPDGTLFRYHQDLTKWTEKHKKQEESLDEAHFNLLDQLDQLPDERAIVLLEGEIERLRELTALHVKALKKYARK